jgi:hypothetical protein
VLTLIALSPLNKFALFLYTIYRFWIPNKFCNLEGFFSFQLIAQKNNELQMFPYKVLKAPQAVRFHLENKEKKCLLRTMINAPFARLRSTADQ